MTDKLTIQVTAQDNASKVFTDLAKSAKTMGDAIEDAGKDSAKSFKDVSKGAKEFGSSLDTLQINMAASSANLSQLADFLGAFSDAAVENQRQTMALSLLYGDAAGEISAYADAVQNATAYSNESARQAAISFGTLQQNYGLTTEQIKQLIDASADLAAVSGLDLADAAQRVQAAIRGEGEAAEALGLTMNQQSIDLENLTLTMTNQEAAQFRLNALLEQSAFAQGAAADMASTSAGKYAQLQNTFQDITVSAADMLGPLPLIGSALADVASESFTVVGGGAALVGMFGKAGAAAKNAGTAIKGSSLAMSGLALATNPVALAIAGVGVVAGAGYAIWKHHEQGVEDAKAAYEELTGAIKLTDDIVRNLNLEGKFELADSIKQEIDESRAVIDQFGADMSEVNWFANAEFTGVPDMQAKLLDFLGKAFSPEVIQYAKDNMGLTDELLNQMIAGDMNALLGGVPLIQDAAKEYYTAFAPTDQDRTELEEAWQPLFDLFTNPRIDTAKLDAKMDELRQQMIDTGEDTTWLADQYKALFNDITTVDTFGILGDSMEGAGKQATTFFGIMNEGIDSLASKLAESLPEQSWFDRLLQSTGATDAFDVDAFWSQMPWNQPQPDVPKAVRDSKEQWIAYINEVPKFSDEWYERTEEFKTWADDEKAAREAYADTIRETQQAALDAVNAGLDGMEAANEERKRLAEEALALEQEWAGRGLELAGIDTVSERLDLAGLGNQYTQLASNINNANDALSAGFQIIVGNTNAIGQTVASVEAWGKELIGVAGEYGKIDDLLQAGLITQTQYTDAQAAYNSIAQDNAEIQNDILTIQTNQVPVLADLVSRQEDYMEQLARMPADQQAIALGWMDANTAAKANEAISLAAAAANGELGASGKQAAQDFIDGAIAANPYLEGMLESIGLISGPDHKINFDAAQGLSEIDRLTEAIVGLVDYFDNGVIDGSFNISVNGKEQLDDTKQTLDAASKAEYNTSLNVTTKVDGSEGGAAGLGERLRNVFSGLFGGPGEGDGTGGAAYTVTAMADLDTANFDSAAAAVSDYLDDLDGDSSTLLVEGDNNDAMSSMQEAEQRHQGLDGNDVTLVVLADISQAMDAMGDVSRRLSDLDGDRATVDIYGDKRDAQADIWWAQSYDGDVLSTSFMDIVTRHYDTYSGGGGYSAQHGGVLGYANGGIVVPAELAEAGPELLHFASGGTALVQDRGIYGVPQGTYVSPAPASASAASGGVTVNVNVYGTITSDQIATEVGTIFFRVLTDAVNDVRRGQGDFD